MESFFIYPALLFPAIPLMMTNFTHRYNSCAALVRKIHAEIIEKKIVNKFENKAIPERVWISLISFIL